MLGSLLGLIILLGVLALFTLAAIWLFNRMRTTTLAAAVGRNSAISPLEVIQRRLAAGEIALDEYHRIREELRG